MQTLIHWFEPPSWNRVILLRYREVIIAVNLVPTGIPLLVLHHCVGRYMLNMAFSIVCSTCIYIEIIWKIMLNIIVLLQTKHKRTTLGFILTINDSFNCVTFCIKVLGWLKKKEGKPGRCGTKMNKYNNKNPKIKIIISLIIKEYKIF